MLPQKSHGTMGRPDATNKKENRVPVNPINLIRGLFAAALLLCAAIAQAGVNSWTLSGPEGGWAFQAAFHPTNSQIAVLSTVRGLYRTTDGSAHWTLVNDGANGPTSPSIPRTATGCSMPRTPYG